MTNAPGNHNFPPVALLRSEGVTVFSGSDNIRGSWWPYGDGDMLHRAEIIGYRSGFYTDDELKMAFDIVTAEGATALRLSDWGVSVGAKADFVTLAATCIPKAVVASPNAAAFSKSANWWPRITRSPANRTPLMPLRIESGGSILLACRTESDRH